MKTSVELRQARQVEFDAQKEIKRVADTRAEGERDFTEDEATRFDACQDRYDVLTKDIERAEKFEANTRAAAAIAANPVMGDKGDEGEDNEKRSIQERFDVKRMMGFVVDKHSFDGAEAEVNEIALEELRNSGVNNISTKGFNVPASMAFRGAKGLKRATAQTATEDGGAFGGTTVQEEAGRVLPAFVDRLSIEDLGISPKYDVVGDYPLHSVADFAFENVGETEGLTAQKAGTSKRILKPKRTGMMAYISNQLLVQSSTNIMSVLGQRINEALSRRLFLDMLNGDGVAPNCLGLLNDALAFEYAGAAAAFDLVKTLELEGEVDEENATEDGLRFLLHKKLAAVLKGVRIDTGSGLMLMDKENKLYGMETSKTSLMPVLNGGTEYPVLYGDFKSVEAAFWGGLNIKADETTRADSNEVRLIVNVHRDIMASNPKAFAVNKKVLLT